MAVKPTPAYRGLLALTILFSLAALLTLAPRAGASYPNVLGYKSLCTFAPIATALCGLAAGITCFVRARLVKPRPRAGKSPAAPMLVFLVLLALAIAFVPSYAKWKADEVSSATVYEG